MSTTTKPGNQPPAMQENKQQQNIGLSFNDFENQLNNKNMEIKIQNTNY